MRSQAISLELVLSDKHVVESLAMAWRDSKPGPHGGHEEGGFVVRKPGSPFEVIMWPPSSDSDVPGEFACIRWPTGRSNQIIVSSHADCQLGGCDIVISFHTHPNTGTDYQQEPSDTDIKAVRDDPHLKGPEYLGELVISRESVYHIKPDGSTRVLSRTSELLAWLKSGVYHGKSAGFRGIERRSCGFTGKIARGR
jgi:hypothetical protein